MIAVDTNVVVRLIMADDEAQLAAAKARLPEGLFISHGVLMEVEWVLRSAYGYMPPEIARTLRAFGGLTTVEIEDAVIVAAALDLAERGMDFADALHLGKSTHCDGFVTFDRKLIQVAQTAGHDNVLEA